MSTPANKRRAIERENCRSRLAFHIQEKLGLQIRPSNVRLQPIEKDGYQWKFDDPQSYLFEKPLSDLSTNMYIELVEQLDIGNIQAIGKEFAQDSSTQSLVERLEEEVQGLKIVNQQLQQNLEQSHKSQSMLRTEIYRLHKLNEMYADKCKRFALGQKQARLHIQKFVEILNSMSG